MSFALRATLAGWHTHCMASLSRDEPSTCLDVFALMQSSPGERSGVGPDIRGAGIREAPSARQPLEPFVSKRRHGEHAQIPI
jgi:hypothetical protein